MSCDAVYGCVKEDSTFFLMGRVNVDGAIWSQSQVSSIAWSAWDVNSPDTKVVDAAALTVSTVVFNALQLDGRWPDATGYNFRHTVGPTTFTTPGQYRIEHKVTLVGGAVFFLGPWIVQVEDVWTS